MLDHIHNGQAYGDVASILLQNNFDPRALRPYAEREGQQPYITVNGPDGKPAARPVHNANSTLLIREWIDLDRAVTRQALPRLNAVSDLRNRGLEYNVPGGMGKTVLQSQRTGDINQATISMDGMADSPSDRPVFDSISLPLPIIHKDFQFTARQIAVSRQGGMPLDVSMAELAARKVAEGAEQLLIGNSAGTYSYGGGSVYGFTTFPGRITKALTLPTTTNQAITIAEVISMRQLAFNNFHYGPFILYVSPLWAQYLDGDYILTGGNVATQTLRERLESIDGITEVKTLNFLPGYDMVLIELDSATIREVVGMDITTVQWPSHGGMMLNFKIMCILVPQIRADIAGNTGIVHGHVSGQSANPTGMLVLPNGNP